MKRNGHRAMLGAEIKPPYQNGMAIGSYIRKFENFVLREDGIRMDSADMSTNTVVNNIRRRQFISRLDSRLRQLVTQPEYDATWHAFTHAYIAGFTRLFPRCPIYESTNINNFKTKNIQQRPRLPFRQTTFGNQTRDKQPSRSFKPFGNTSGAPFKTPSFLSNCNTTGSQKTFTKSIPKRPQHQKNYSTQIPNRTNPKRQVNSIQSELKSTTNTLSSLMRKLNLFDITKYAITIITFITLISPCVAWECLEMPPFFPHLYTQSSYVFSAFKRVDISDHGDPCESEIFRPIYRLHDILLDTSFSPPIETVIEEDSRTCNNGKVYVNKTDDTMLAIRNEPLIITDFDYNQLLNFYVYHYNFNMSCPESADAEIQLGNGKIVPTSPLNKRKRLHPSITNNELTYNKSKIQLDEASDTMKQLRSENQALMNIKTFDNDDIKKLMERSRTLEQSNARLQHDANKLQHV